MPKAERVIGGGAEPAQLPRRGHADQAEAQVGLQLLRQRLCQQQPPVHPALVVTQQSPDLRL